MALNFRLPTNSVRLVIAPEEVKARVAVLPIGEGEPEVLIPAGVRIAVKGQDASGSWSHRSDSRIALLD